MSDTDQPCTWIVLGSSPFAPLRLEACRAAYPAAKLITCNAGIRLVPTPDVYCLSDIVALDLYREEALVAQRNGTHCITIRADGPAFHWCDEVFSSILQTDKILSGILCMEWVCEKRGAERVVMVGCDGYRHSRDYFDSNPTRNRKSLEAATTDHVYRFIQGANIRLASEYMHQSTTNTGYMQQFMPRVFNHWKKVQWVFYGQPLYDIQAPNLEIVQCDP